MSVKDEVLRMLENNKGSFFSGATLAEELNVSRNAVWKAVNSLKEAGYKIDSVPNKGYCLMPDSDIISVQSISKYLSESCKEMDITVYTSISSTNTVLKEMASNGAPKGTVLVAQSQTAGRGRLGRNFHSPSNTGIYFSILLRPSMPAEQSLFLTTSAAVAVSRAIEAVSSNKADIKWVNDVYINDKKVCGILTEGSFNVETGKLDYAVVGIGINVCPPKDGFPDMIKDIAGTVFTNEEDSINSRSLLVAQVLNNFMDFYKNFHERKFYDEYKKRSFLIGRKIFVVEGDKYTPATAMDLDDECHLIVKFEDGTVKSLSSGEVSIKLNK